MADHLQQAAAGMVILLVHLQVVGQIVDALCKHCDLHFRGAVSPSWSAYSAMIAFFSSLVMLVTSFKNSPGSQQEAGGAPLGGFIQLPRAGHNTCLFYHIEWEL
jgi:hypothetical protein